MLLTRNLEEKPPPYKGIQMRSKLELRCAQYLDHHEVIWTYEQPVDPELVGGKPIPYLPDFTIALFPNGLFQLELGTTFAHWIEVKPQEFLYGLRDHLGVPERCNKFVEVTGDELRGAGIEELWKPKRLAELADADVLVVGNVDKTRTLSITMRPDGVHFRTDHPFVNYREVQRQAEQARQRAQWAWEEAQRRAHWEAEQRRIEDERRAAEAAQWRARLEQVLPMLRTWARGAANYPGVCRCCFSHYREADLSIYRRDGDYRLVCHGCETRAAGA